MSRGIIIAAPSSGSGKTTVTLGLLRLLRRLGYAPNAAKIGPDYLDPGFHTAASGVSSINLDIWAMREETFMQALNQCTTSEHIVIAEGVMGLFDGATLKEGSTADVAAITGWPVVLVIDASGMAASAAGIVHGFATYRKDIHVTGVIFNQVGSERHALLLREALAPLGIPVLGAIPQNNALSLPSRHLGLVLAEEHQELAQFLDQAADVLEQHLDIPAFMALARPIRAERASRVAWPLRPWGQHIAIAHDIAFAFVYPLTVKGWRAAGAQVSFFSPLNDEVPDPSAEAIFLPGGYPELHAGPLASKRLFLRALRKACDRGVFIYGECGGFMVLGESLTDSEGKEHPMAGLLPVTTTFAKRRLTLGYREAVLLSPCPLGPAGLVYRGHEFHFAKIEYQANCGALFHCRDARNNSLGELGLMRDRVMGSFVHLIDEYSLGSDLEPV